MTNAFPLEFHWPHFQFARCQEGCYVVGLRHELRVILCPLCHCSISACHSSFCSLSWSYATPTAPRGRPQLPSWIVGPLFELFFWVTCFRSISISPHFTGSFPAIGIMEGQWVKAGWTALPPAWCGDTAWCPNRTSLWCCQRALNTQWRALKMLGPLPVSCPYRSNSGSLLTHIVIMTNVATALIWWICTMQSYFRHDKRAGESHLALDGEKKPISLLKARSFKTFDCMLQRWVNWLIDAKMAVCSLSGRKSGERHSALLRCSALCFINYPM